MSFCVCLWLWSVAGAVGTRTGAMSRCILTVYTSYKQYPTVRTRERPPVRVPWAIYENRLTSAHLGLDPATSRTVPPRLAARRRGFFKFRHPFCARSAPLSIGLTFIARYDRRRNGISGGCRTMSTWGRAEAARPACATLVAVQCAENEDVRHGPPWARVSTRDFKLSPFLSHM